MAKKQIFSVICIILLVVSISLFAQNKTSEKPPPGTEVVYFGTNAKILVPEGAKIKNEGGIITIENSREYSARKFLEADNRFKTIEAKITLLTERVGEINAALKDIQKKLLNFNETDK